ncbi:hypothetical protein [Nocardioides marmoribigeumensis]|jgi:hypothetical protein|uniref:Uncharacterized protein n=1 Tax=Nocardioides marmoribigeumensis TaxID=433649 RepID=A0ABU2BZ93_9ACTN|nr:hypothetical protein [Nocardioides marmoribigeumensis]MDR7363726.1 hypothetical protein [Nocardioides marmoribigeumensis]
MTTTAPETRLTLPKVGTRSGSGIAPLRGNGAATLQLVLFVGGAVMLPLGLVVIILGWYGASNTPYQYDQLSYLVSGGLFGLGLTFCGGFLYFGAWLARIAADQRESAKRLADTLLVLADVVSAPGPVREPGSVLVVAGGGATVHRADCALVAGRDDVAPAGADGADLHPCRVCRPGA